VNNVIANVGGCLWRRQALPPSVWDEAKTYGVLGDWFLYASIAGGGQIAWDPEAIAYFRQHDRNTSVTSFVKPSYYNEHERLMLFLRERWDIPQRTVEKFYEKVAWQYDHHNLASDYGPLNRYFSKKRLLSTKRDRPHILVAFRGFIPGGGEVFPINLANELHAQGHRVSMLALDMIEVNPEMLASLNRAVAVYDALWVQEYGADRFLTEAGFSLINSHMFDVDQFFFETCRLKKPIPYVLTLHGSYEVSGPTLPQIRRIARRITHFVYTA